MPSSSSTPRRADRNVRLDPMGIYGTRSERRRQQLQRRRQYQNGILWLLGTAGLAFGAWWVFQPHPTLLRAGWSVPLPIQTASAPLITNDGQIYLTSQSGGLWKISSAQSTAVAQRIFATAFPPGAQPLAGTKNIFWPGSDGVLRSIDNSGHQKWARALPSTIVTRPALAHTKTRAVVAAGDDAGNLAVFDAVSGAPLWSHQLGGALGDAIAVSEGATPGFICPTLAGVISGGGLVCLDANSGAPRWRFPTKVSDSGAGIAAPAVSQGKVFWGNDEGAVVCLNAANGQKIWKTFAPPRVGGKPTDAEAQNLLMLRGAPTVVESVNTVVLGGNDGLLRAFDSATGRLKWTTDLGGPVLFPARKVTYEGVDALIVSASAPGMFLIEPETGRILRHWGTPHGTEFGADVVGNTAFAMDSEGHLQGASLQ